MGNLIDFQNFSLEADSNPALVGNVKLASGTSITLVQTGQTITINSSGGGGGGTVNAGTQYQLAYYAANGSAVSGLTLITASRALVSDANGLPVASTTTTTELTYVHGVTSAIQTQLDSKAPTANPTFTGNATFTGQIFGNFGTANNPGYAFDGQPSSGAWYDNTHQNYNISIANNNLIRVSADSNLYQVGALTTESGVDLIPNIDNTPVASNADSGFIFSSLVSGPPTGGPSYAGAIVFDPDANILYIFSNTGWKSVALS